MIRFGRTLRGPKMYESHARNAAVRDPRGVFAWCGAGPRADVRGAPASAGPWARALLALP